ncbi:uncharacterized protein MELLADRAFT_41456 [Melampsora larici-populina 98AG31]|uniref:2,4-dienoyl-CoA reductase [(3E)-enoyl-CoA-producing] n=1 Tax=Melampsora larici-populina (strain 98AG31 / pathotype 3-4-7) TaxID=747676 RepID=F4R3P2_MELLP|nr:uncharacterized protein MELLADRAFT_41456 [Melampsora larici-populina 98AG31]EGG12662.1 hypothetical protein MELLADRAFT_41456 [Melampsora larici-populina 98AG31]
MKSNPSVSPVLSNTVFKDDIFRGKVLFCTGGGTGICKKMVEAVMRHGASAFIFGRREEVLSKTCEELINSTQQKCSFSSGDVRKIESLQSAVESCIKEFGRIDFVIAGAAGNFLSSIDQLSVNGFKSVIEIDLLGTYHTMKATLPYVKKTGGSFISVSATLHYVGTPFQAHVSAAKAGVDALSQAMAVEFGPFGIRSNVIAPGPIADTEGFSRLSTSETRKTMAQGIPLQRFGSRDDIGNTTVFLFSPAASFITGTIIVVDGGENHLRSTTSLGSYYPKTFLQNDGEEFSKLVSKL